MRQGPSIILADSVVQNDPQTIDLSMVNEPQITDTLVHGYHYLYVLPDKVAL
jgi:hypothetical protein